MDRLDIGYVVEIGLLKDLYLKVSDDEIDLVLSYQRRAFQDKYENYHLRYVPCLIETSARSKLAWQESVCVDELRKIPFILNAKKEQQEWKMQQAYIFELN